MLFGLQGYTVGSLNWGSKYGAQKYCNPCDKDPQHGPPNLRKRPYASEGITLAEVAVHAGMAGVPGWNQKRDVSYSLNSLKRGYMGRLKGATKADNRSFG